MREVERERERYCGESMRDRHCKEGIIGKKRKTDIANLFHLSSLLPHQHLSHIIIRANYDLTAHARGQNTNVSGLNTFLSVVIRVRRSSKWVETVEIVNISFDWRARKENKCVRRMPSLCKNSLTNLSYHQVKHDRVYGDTWGELRERVITRAIYVFQWFYYVYYWLRD